MKKTDIFKIIFGAIPTCFLGGIAGAYSNNTIISNIKTTNNDNDIKTISAALFGAKKGTVDVKFTGHECTIVKANHDFVATGNFNFNGGKFTYDRVEYTITEIGDEAFYCNSVRWFFKKCNLTIPASIKRIGKDAFNWNSTIMPFPSKEIINIYFKNGIEDIGEGAFSKCRNLVSNELVLPNSVRHIGNKAFSQISPVKDLDLTALDHVIDLDVKPFDVNGCLFSTAISKIWVKDQAMKDKYCRDKYWSSAAKYFVILGYDSKTISSSYIGANNESTFDFNCLDPKQAKITGISNNFLASGDFNFNNGEFTYNNVEYAIKEITSDTFNAIWTHWYFENCKLTIPSTVKTIGDRAFYGNSRNSFGTKKEIIGINFNEGVEDIGKEAFKKCDDLESDKLVLPNSLQHIGNNAFEDISPLEELDLSALDHVINLDADPFSKDGCLYNTKISKIWVKDQEMKDKYCSNKHWSSVAKYFVLKAHTFETISSSYIGANSEGTFDFNYLDPKQTKITGVSNKFVTSGDFNFNNGKFTYKNVEHAISEIASDAFHAGSTHWCFKKCKLTIPSTVKTIGDRAFYGNSRNSFVSKKEIININFNEGVEEIGEEAFKKCDDLESDKLLLPNSLQHIGNNAFEDISPLKELDLSALDHVINLDADPFDKDGCLYNTKISKIWVKDIAMKAKYCSDKHWSSVAKYFVLKAHTFETISSSYIGANSEGTFDFNYLDPKQTKITGVSNKFVASGDFNFNNGKFTYKNVEHVISEIASDAFHAGSTHWCFKKCKLTIPSTVKTIGDRAFYGNSRNSFVSKKEIININFNEGIEDIGKEAFKKCDDLESDRLVLPNSLQHIGNNAFEDISPLKELDLSALDHVINIDADPFDKDGCLYNTKISKIWVKDIAMKAKYCNDKHWSSVSENIKIK